MKKKFSEASKVDGYTNQLKTHIYLGLAVIITLLFVLMFVITNLNYYMRDKKDVLENKEYLNLNLEEEKASDVIERDGDHLSFNLITKNKDNNIEDALKQAKISYSVNESLKDIKNTDKNLILDGSLLKDQEDLSILKKLISEKRKIILLGMPDSEFIEANDLKKILGIARIKEETKKNELNLVPGFMLGGFHEFKNMTYESKDIKLLYSAKVYGYGKENSPVIWRNVYEECEIYVINGSFMNTNASYGVLSSIMAEAWEDYIYPVVNARFMTYEGFPYISEENKNNLVKLYNRGPMRFQYDILMPNILTVNNRREFVPNGYLRAGFKDISKNDINNHNIKQANSVKAQIYTSGGDVGLRYSGDAGHDKKVYEQVFKGKEVKSIILNDKVGSMPDVLKVSESLESIVGPWDAKNTFSYIDKDTVYIPLTFNGIKNGGKERFEFVSAVTAFGSVVQNLNVEELVLNSGESENWTQISKEYIEFIDEYRKRFEFLKSRNAESAAKAVKIFKKNAPKIVREDERIKIIFDEWNGPSYFILRSKKVVDNVVGGQATKIEDGSYLITAQKQNVEINLSYEKNTKARR